MLKVHEGTSAEGELSPVFLRVESGTLELVDGPSVVPISEVALLAVMMRYGAPFDPTAEITTMGTLKLNDRQELRHVRHLAGYDVIARDYIVYLDEDSAPLCALATTVTAALGHLGRAALGGHSFGGQP